jgi:phasin family protein
MLNVVEYFTAYNQATLATAERLGRLSLETSEQFAQLALGYSKTAFEDIAKDAKSVASVRDFSDFYATRSKVAESAATKAQAFAKDSYALATNAQAEVSKLVEERVAAMHKVAVDFVEASSKSAPAGSEAAVAAMKSAVAASGVVFDTMTKVGRQAQGFVEAAAKAGEASADNVKAFTVSASKKK